MVTVERLSPRWPTALLLVLIVIGLAASMAMALVESGAARAAGVVGSLFIALNLLAFVRAMVMPRRRRELAVDENGTLTITAPGLVVWPLVVAWGALPVLAVVFVVQAIVDFDSIESPGAVFAVVAAAAASLPDWWRLVRGRLYRWRLVLTPDGLTYRGYRTAIEVPWSKVHGASVHRAKPVGTLVDLKGTRPDLVIQQPVFDLPPEQIVEEIERYSR